MRRVAVLLSVWLSACGGAVDKNEPTASAGGTASATPESNSVEVIDDMDHTDGRYPAVPPGSSSFFWRGGLGNWFVTSSDGVTRDAPIEEIVPAQGESGKACHVSGVEPGVSVDLWAQLNHPGGLPVDLSAYSGITFRVRLGGLTDPDGLLIVAFGANGQFFHRTTAFAQRRLAVSAEWQDIELFFDELDVETSAVSSIDFVVSQPEDPVDLWVDDLAFLCNGTCPE